MNDQPNPRTLDALASNSPNVPLPKRKWLVRFGLPMFLILSAGGVLTYTSWQALRPTTSVQATIVAVRTVETNAPRERSNSALVQAPGWVEPDPFSNYVAALTEGVVEEIMVLEGDRVEVDQIVAKLIDDDAHIHLQRATAMVTQRTGERESAEAILNASILELEELVEQTLSVATTEAMLWCVYP